MKLCRALLKSSYMFVTEDDYKTVCDDFEFEALQAHTDLRLKAELAAMEEISSYTRHRYDMAAAYRKTGEDRNPMLVQCVVNIALWYMVHRMPENMGHERRECLYNDSIKWLRDVQASKATPDLPTYVTDEGEEDAHNPVKWGSQKKTSVSW